MKNKKFDNILNDCLERMLQGETIEQCLQSYPEQATELEPMLRTAATFGKIYSIQPRPEFKARARYEFHSALHEMATRKKRRFFAWQAHWATALVAVLVVFVLGSGTVAVAAKSMPDGPLYPVKLATEEAKVALARSDEQKAELYAEMAENRVEEIAYVARKGKPEHLEIVAQHLNVHLARVAMLAAPESGVEMAQEQVVGEGPKAFSTPEIILNPPAATRSPSVSVTPSGRFPPGNAPFAPPGAQRPGPQVRGNENRGKSEDARARERAALKETMKRQALKNPDRLRALLKTAPESVKPALNRAITLSEKAYEKALGSITAAEK